MLCAVPGLLLAQNAKLHDRLDMNQLELKHDLLRPWSVQAHGQPRVGPQRYDALSGQLVPVSGAGPVIQGGPLANFGFDSWGGATAVGGGMSIRVGQNAYFSTYARPVSPLEQMMGGPWQWNGLGGNMDFGASFHFKLGRPKAPVREDW